MPPRLAGMTTGPAYALPLLPPHPNELMHAKTSSLWSRVSWGSSTSAWAVPPFVSPPKALVATFSVPPMSVEPAGGWNSSVSLWLGWAAI